MTNSIPKKSARSLRWCLRLTLGTLLLLGAPEAHAADPSDLGTIFQVDDKEPLKTLPTETERNAHPLEFGYYLQDLIAHAEGAGHRKEWANAAKLYEALARVVPDRAIVFSRLCFVYSELGQVDVAAANCGKAIHLGGALVHDHLDFIRLTLQKKTFSDADAANIDRSLAHLRAKAPALLAPANAAPEASVSASPSSSAVPPSGEQSASEVARRAMAHVLAMDNAATPPTPQGALAADIEVLACRLGVRLHDAKRLDACLDALRRVKADERLTVSFAWSRALIVGDRAGAQAILEQARALALPESALNAMAAEQDKLFAPAGLLGLLRLRGSAAIVALVVVGLALAAGLWWALSQTRRRKLAAASQS